VRIPSATEGHGRGVAEDHGVLAEGRWSGMALKFHQGLRGGHGSSPDSPNVD